MAMRIHSALLVVAIVTFACGNALDSKAALMHVTTPDVHSTVSHLSNVDELSKRNLRKVVIDEDDSEDDDEKETTNEDDSEDDEERGPPGTSVSAIESLVTKSDDALVAFRKAIAAEKAAAATKAAELA
ncbi:hypothetical protein PHMEG_00017283 [Phytophthora megakarya]|uniref:RxLR effector protein n=1 Tax=Phytophthora megakarya TaxID=4795 RepID=A0A225VZA6_9STRA|nr:hypothetical protein PHMEG_00017283 [Phytophthora megakarya]